MIGVLVTFLFNCTVSVFSFPITVCFASPSATQGHVHCETIDNYTVNWFEIQVRWRQSLDLPLIDALFYTRGVSEMARKYACDYDLAIIWRSRCFSCIS